MRALLPITIAILLHTSLAHADLIPPGGEGVGECRNKKAGDACQLAFFAESGIRLEDGKCVEAKLDHLPLKYKAHLRCEVPPKPAASASASASAAPSAAPVAPAPTPAPAPAPSIANEPAKSSGNCSMGSGANGEGILLIPAIVMVLRRRRKH